MDAMGLAAQAGAVGLGLVFALVAYLLGRHYAERIWGLLWRRGQEDAERIHQLLAGMFKQTPLPRCRIMVWGGSLLGGLLALLFTWGLAWPATAAFTLIAAWLAGRVPLRLVKSMRAKYITRCEDQLCDALTMMASALRSGLSLPQGLDLVAREMPQPISQEMGLVLNQQKMGRSLDDALSELAERVPSDDLVLAVNAVLILRETGGNLSETFDTIVYTISERDKVRGKIKTLTAQGVAQGVILTAMPFVLGWVLHLINPDYMRPMFTSVLGWIMLGFMGALLAVGGMMIRKIVTIDV